MLDRSAFIFFLKSTLFWWKTAEKRNSGTTSSCDLKGYGRARGSLQPHCFTNLDPAH